MRLFLAFSLALFAACSASPERLEAELGQCLMPGSTTFADAVLCLGVPSQAYEDGRILIFPGIIELPSGSSSNLFQGVRIRSSPPRFHEVAGFIPAIIADMVLTFDDRWVLRSFGMRKRLGVKENP